MISNLQVLRGLAALAVVLYHTSFPLPLAVQHTEFQAVPVFFVISGFVMTYITKSSAAEFLVNRFTRIVPIYWIVTLFMFVWALSGIQNLPSISAVMADAYRSGGLSACFWQIVDNLRVSVTNDRLIWLLKSLAFVPMERSPVDGVGWSLNYEVFYYLVFGLCLLLGRRIAPIAAALVLIGLSAVAGAPMIQTSYGSYYNLYFAGGIFIFYVWRALDAVSFPLRSAIYAAIAIALICIHLGTQIGHSFGISWLHTAYGMVLGALLLHSAGARMTWKFPVFLGDISYSLYLTHEVVMETCRPYWGAYPIVNAQKSVAALVGYLALTVAVASFVHLSVEKPIIRLTRRILTGRPKTNEIPPASSGALMHEGEPRVGGA